MRSTSHAGNVGNHWHLLNAVPAWATSAAPGGWTVQHGPYVCCHAAAGYCARAAATYPDAAA